MKNYFESLDLTKSLQKDKKWKVVKYRVRGPKDPMKKIGASKLSTLTDIAIAHFSPEGQNGQRDETLQKLAECLNLCSNMPHRRIHNALNLGMKIGEILSENPKTEVLPSSYKQVFSR